MQAEIGLIGSGIAGLAAAIRLTVKGYKVTVFEANNYVGGKLTSFTNNGFRFDAGPSLFTMPQYLEEVFQLAGKPMSDYLNYKKLDVITHYFYEDGTRFKSFANLNDFAQTIEENLNVPKETVLNYLAHSKKLFDLTEDMFLKQSLHKTKNYFNKHAFKAGLQITQLDLLSTMHGINTKKLQHPKLIQYFDRFATYNGSNPYKAPATLNIIPHLEHNIGAFFPENGMIGITNALYQLAKEVGVNFHLNERVEKILVEHKKVIGLKTDQSNYNFSKVISNMDIVPTYKKLLANELAPTKILEQPRSSSAIIFYWGINSVFKVLGLHNILFSANYKAEFDYIFNQKMLYDDPTIYINISSKENKSDAPNGCENWFVMVNAPNVEHQDWDLLIKQAKTNIIAKIKRILQVDISDLILTEDILDPRSIEYKTSSYKGALYGNSSNNKFAAFLRHPNFSKKIKGLYFCGGSVHPGGGIPLCLLSAKIVDELI